MSEDLRNVFISHIHEDDEGLAKFKTLLTNHGVTARDYSIHQDNPNNAHSESYIKSEILAPRIRQSGTLIVYISPSTKDSEYVRWEIEYAHKQAKHIVGVWAHGEKGCDVPEALDKYADAVVGWTGNSIIDAIEGKIEGWHSPDGAPAAERNIARYRCR